MNKLSQDTVCLLTAMVLLTTSILVVGHDVRKMKIEIHQTKADACYKAYEMNRNTGEIYLAQDYCAE